MSISLFQSINTMDKSFNSVKIFEELQSNVKKNFDFQDLFELEKDVFINSKNKPIENSNKINEVLVLLEQYLNEKDVEKNGNYIVTSEVLTFHGNNKSQYNTSNYLVDFV